MRLHLGRDIQLGDAGTGHLFSTCRHNRTRKHGAALSMDAHVRLVQISLVLLVAGVCCPFRPSSTHRHRLQDATTQAMLTGLRGIHSRRKVLETIVIRETTDDEDLAVDPGSGMELTGSSDRKDLKQPIKDMVPTVKPDCCQVGRMSALGGLHCDVGLHAAMLHSFNRTRDFNRRGRLPAVYHHLLSPPMRSFSMCVTKRSLEFYKCCRAAKAREKETRLWYRGPFTRPRQPQRSYYNRRPYFRG